MYVCQYTAPSRVVCSDDLVVCLLAWESGDMRQIRRANHRTGIREYRMVGMSQEEFYVIEGLTSASRKSDRDKRQ